MTDALFIRPFMRHRRRLAWRGKGPGNRGSLLRRGFDPNASSLSFNPPFDERQTEAGTRCFVYFMPVFQDLLKFFKDIGPSLFWNANPRVCDTYNHFTTGATLRPQGDLAVIGSVFEGVGHQMLNDLLSFL